jgi:hypothetical protein
MVVKGLYQGSRVQISRVKDSFYIGFYNNRRTHLHKMCCFFVVLVDLSSMIAPHLSQIMLKYHLIETQE